MARSLVCGDAGSEVEDQDERAEVGGNSRL